LTGFTDTFWTNCKGPVRHGEGGPNPRARRRPLLPVRGHARRDGAAESRHGLSRFQRRDRGPRLRRHAVHADWPTSTEPGLFPGTTPQAQPTSHGQSYPQIQFETDLAATEEGCDLSSGAGCTVPPPGPGHFYPYWTLAKDRQLGCTWQFGNAGGTGNSFGGDTQYGQITFNPPGAFTSQIQPNPGCGQRS
jgi:hypothetical protein